MLSAQTPFLLSESCSEVSRETEREMTSSSGCVSDVDTPLVSVRVVSAGPGSLMVRESFEDLRSWIATLARVRCAGCVQVARRKRLGGCLES